LESIRKTFWKDLNVSESASRDKMDLLKMLLRYQVSEYIGQILKLVVNIIKSAFLINFFDFKDQLKETFMPFVFHFKKLPIPLLYIVQ